VKIIQLGRPMNQPGYGVCRSCGCIAELNREEATVEGRLICPMSELRLHRRAEPGRGDGGGPSALPDVGLRPADGAKSA
jgi:hypothetical protein